MTPAQLETLRAARTAHRPVVLATRLADGAQHLLPDTAQSPALSEAASRALADDRSQIVQIEGEDWFLHVHNPPHRVIIVGAVHIAQALIPLIAQLGMAAILVDPRRAFATGERFPDIAIRHEWPDTALDALAPDQRTAIVTLTHDPKIDDPALDRALRSPAFYIGALGSRKTQAARLERLAAEGHAPAALARIRGPVGLRLGALTTAEIALSIAAEIVAVRRGGACATPA